MGRSLNTGADEGDRFVEGVGFRPLLYLVILLETVGFVLLGVGLMAEMVAQLRHEVDSLRRRLR